MPIERFSRCFVSITLIGKNDHSEHKGSIKGFLALSVRMVGGIFHWFGGLIPLWEGAFAAASQTQRQLLPIGVILIDSKIRG
ncbi:MAG: hypothetical protein COB37_07025 [Kordiimonadales bacterium]|nr:MAG: hypothetical protein COB37_07025 [Kordiimonadales bacterium]